MAIIKFGPTVTGIRGTVAGTIFSANKAGPYARAWSRPSNRRTASQTDRRSKLAHAAGLWRTEDSGDRDDWDTWAALPAQEKTNSLGEAYYVSGFDWYVAINIRLELMGRSWRHVFPDTAAPDAPTISYLVPTETVLGGTIKIIYPMDTFTGYDIVADVAVTQGVGQQTTVTGYYQVLRSTTPGITDTYCGPDFRTILGYAITGNMYHAHVFRQRVNGMRSAPSSISEVCI